MLRGAEGRLMAWRPQGVALATTILFGFALVSTAPVRSGESPTQAGTEPSGTNEGRPAVPALEPGQLIEGELAGGEADAYQLVLDSGQYLEVVVDQRGIDVAVTLFGPDGKKLAEANSSGGTQEAETLSLIAEASGSYRLEVCAAQNEAQAGRYGVRIEELRGATPEDIIRTDAKEAFSEGERLRAQETAESLQAASAKYVEALSLWRRVDDLQGEAKTLSSLGEVYYRLGEKHKALEYHNQALPLWRAVGDRGGEASALTRIGVVYLDVGEKQKALAHFNQGLPIMRAAGDLRGETSMLTHVGNFYNSLGDKRKALEYYNQALPLARESGDRYIEAFTLNNMGNLARSLGESLKALEYLNQALLLRRTVGDRRGEASTLSHTASVYVDLGEKRKALEYFNQALWVRQVIGDRWGEANALFCIGRVYSGQGEHQKGLEYFNRALTLTRAVGDRIGEAEAMSATARVARDRGNLIEARSQSEAALKIIESLRTKVGSRELRVTYFASVRKHYEFYIDLLIRLDKERPSEGFDVVALEASERGRARSLLELLTEARADIRQGVDPALLERERSLQQLLSAKAERQMRLLSGKYTEEQATAAAKELEVLTTQLQDVEGQIRVKSPRYAALTQPQPLSLKEIQEHVLDPDTLLLEYALGEERSFLWAVTQTSVASYELAKRPEIETAARRVYDVLTARNQRQTGEAAEQRRARLAQAEAQFPEAASRLSQMLLAPVASRLGTKRLVVVSDGALQYVPFGVLPIPGAMGEETVSETNLSSPFVPLVVEHEVVSLPSASVLAVLRRELSGREPAAKAVAVLADPVFDGEDPRVRSGGKRPAGGGREDFLSADIAQAVRDVGLSGDGKTISRLPFSRREAEGILAAAPAGVGMKALDFRASRATATSAELGQYRIVHFATHGLLNSEHPELSGVVLSLVNEKGVPQDGFLRLHEVYNLDLPAELVVLSACQTGLGKEVSGEGLVGLTRGFMYAGAPRVVASLWKVDDAATADLMKRFYRGMLADGLRPSAALRAAQVAMWKQTRWKSPYYWGAFVMQGEWR